MSHTKKESLHYQRVGTSHWPVSSIISCRNMGTVVLKSERAKSDALNKNCGSFDALTRLSEEAEKELVLWIENGGLRKCSLEKSEPQLR